MPSLDYPVSSIDEPLRIGGKWFRSGEEATLLKAVTFGPFPAGAFPDEGRGQLRRVREELGANTIRVYEIPSLEFLHECARVGLRVFVTLPWSQHVDFLKRRSALAEADRLLLDTISKFRGHPALAGYLVANEIETTLVRYMGAARVVEQIERLIDLGHANDPDVLFAYANYPSTEYLLPQNQDFVAFNLYLETRESLASYLARLQVLAGDKPLFITEFGVDASAHGEEGQAELVDWAIEETAKAGAAGMTLFSWSDLWQRGGKTVEGWSFGMTRSDQTARPVMESVRQKWETLQRPVDGVSLSELPLVSVIVCTYRGSATLVNCLNSILALSYPKVEVILVNDGGDDRVSEIAASYDSVIHIATEHDGLGAARNTGAAAAKGEIFAYTDDDCVVESDWLQWIVAQFLEDPNLGCAGGPNLPPPPETATQARVAAAPGGPTHVLISDQRAEHLPGCNLAVRREVFEKVGGFQTVFRTAGDDVDFCWRVLAAGHGLGFHAAAFVWHHRRFAYGAYLRQQIGYGKAEALLMPLHPDRFRGVGGAIWEGQVYVARRRFGAVVYHGHYGYEPFQLVQPGSDSWFGEVALHALWILIALGFVLGGCFFAPLLIPAGIMLFGTCWVAVGRAGRSPIAPEYDTTSSRLVLICLILAQGFMRSGTRLMAGWRYAEWTKSLQFVGGMAALRIASSWWKIGLEQGYWSDKGLGREALLKAIREAFPRAVDDPTGKNDILFRKGNFWTWSVITATEYHENEGRLTHLRILARPEPIVRMIVLPLLLITPLVVGYRYGFKSEILSLAGIYVALSVMARVLMWIKRPRFQRIARKAGFKVL